MVGGGSVKLKRWRVSQGHLRTRANGVTRWRVQEQVVGIHNTYRYSGELGLKGGLALRCRLDRESRVTNGELGDMAM